MAHQSCGGRGRNGGNSVGFSSSTPRWGKSERLKQLERDHRSCSNEMKVLEVQIHDLTATLEKQKKFAAKRGDRLKELCSGAEMKKGTAEEKKNLDPKGGEGEEGENGEPLQEQEKKKVQERSSLEGKMHEEIETLKHEQEATERQIQHTKASLEHKRAELEVLAGKYQTLTELIAKEEKLIQGTEIDESAVVHNEMRSLSEDLGRLGRLMEGLKGSNKGGDSLKPSFSLPQQKGGRVYHPVTQLRSRNQSRNLQNGGSTAAGDHLGRSASASLADPPPSAGTHGTKEPSRGKEPAEFEEREGGGNRKRQKNSSFELERAARLQELRAAKVEEAKEKKRSLDSGSRLTSSSSVPSKGAQTTRTSRASSRASSSPSSVFEGLGETPSLGSMGPATSGSTNLTSDSSESSCEFSSGKRDSAGSFTSASKRLDFEPFANKEEPAPSGAEAPSTVEVASRATTEEEITGNSLENSVENVSGQSVEEPKLTKILPKEKITGDNWGNSVEIVGDQSVEEVEITKNYLPGGSVEEGGLDSAVKIVRESSVEEVKVAEAGLEGSSLEKGEVGAEGSQKLNLEGLSSEDRSEESQEPLVSSISNIMEENPAPKVIPAPEVGSGPEIAFPDGGTDDMEELEILGSTSGAGKMQGPEVLFPDSGTEENVTPKVMISESAYEEILEPPASELSLNKREVLEAFSEEFGNTGSGKFTYKEEFGNAGSGLDLLGALDEAEMVLETFSEEFGSPGTGSGMNLDQSLEDAELHSLLEAAGKAWSGINHVGVAVEGVEIHSLLRAARSEAESFDSFREEMLKAVDSFRSAGGEGDVKEEEVIITDDLDDVMVVGIDIPEDMEDFDDAHPAADETRDKQILKIETEFDEVEGSPGTHEVSAQDDNAEQQATEVALPLSVHPSGSGFESLNISSSIKIPLPRQEGQVDAEEMNGDVDESQNRRLEAENQMMQLSSQLSFLQKQVEEELELENDSQLESSPVEKEQLSKQVSFFADEVSGLRQNIDDIQRNISKEGEEDLPAVDHWAKDLQSKCADQSAQLEQLGKQVSMLGKYVQQHLQFRVHTGDKLTKGAQERHKVEAQITDLSKALAVTASTMKKEEDAAGQVIELQKHMLVEQLNEAEKLRHIAEVRVLTLDNQIEQLEMVCDVAKNIQSVTKYQDKAFKYGIQALVQLVLLAVGVITLYSRVAEPFRASLVPT